MVGHEGITARQPIGEATMWYVNFTKNGTIDSITRQSYWQAWKETVKLYIGGADTVVIEYVPNRF
jgi:hypothetical protein